MNPTLIKRFLKPTTVAAVIGIGLSLSASLYANEPVYKDPTQPIKARVDDLLGKMTLEEKVSYITGGKLENKQEAIRGIERLNIPDFVIAHGPYGMKMRYLNERNQVMVLAGTYMPVSIAMAATWDRDLVEEITQVIGKEMNAVGAMANAGPAMNIIRDTRGGRSFEYFTEDPFLNAEITAAYTTGIQSEKIAATLKHYVANNQELHRHGLDVTVSDRALRELYLPGFEKAVMESDAKIIMGAYNKVNGVYSCENDVILNQILRDEWGFDGFVLSDWGGTQSTVDSANHGLDVEMPSERMYGKKLLAAVNEGKVSEETIDQMVRNVLKVVFWSGAFDQGPMYGREIIRSEEHLAVARKASADSMVLLKNEGDLLPFSYEGVKKIAVIGPNGDYGKHFRNGKYHPGLYQGGGSGQVTPKKESVVTPYAGIKNNAPEGVEVVYAPGSYAESGYGLIPTQYLKTPDTGEEGVRATYYGNGDFNGEPVKTEITKKLDYFWVGEVDIPEAGVEYDKNRFSVEFEATLTAPATREFGFELRNIEGGFAQIFIDDQLIVENTRAGRVNWNAMGSIHLEEGKEYDLKVRFAKRGHFADLAINWDYENLAYLEEAKALAESADLVILTVGLAGQMGETEAGDRNRLELYPAQEHLIKEITKVNPNSAVAIIAGSSITMDAWIEGAPAILTAWYPGEQGGNALSDVIFGKTDPGGRLPITFPVAYEQYPDNYYTYTKEIEYREGVFVGYRYFDRKRMETLFPFGHGLSYTNFDYGDASVSSNTSKIGDTVTVSVELTNTGDRTGSEVVQLYVHDVESSLPRPPQELKAFEKITLDPGESTTVTMELDKRAFAFYSEEAGDWIVEPGEFELLVGSSSRNIQTAQLIELH